VLQVRSSRRPSYSWLCEDAGSDENGALVNAYQVCAHWQGLKIPILMGTLYAAPSRRKEVYSFEYDSNWLKSPHAQVLDPDLAEDRKEYMTWLKMLIAPGGSLGGARPKAKILDKNGHPWIAKFPSRSDEINVGKWEYLGYLTAKTLILCYVLLLISA
jgi:hypothetical protein